MTTSSAARASAKLLKLDRATRDIPVIICTAAVRQVEKAQSHLDGMGIAVVLKPFDIDRRLAAITAILPADCVKSAPHDGGV